MVEKPAVHVDEVFDFCLKLSKTLQFGAWREKVIPNPIIRCINSNKIYTALFGFGIRFNDQRSRLILKELNGKGINYDRNKFNR